MLEEISGKLDWETGLFELQIYAVIDNKPVVMSKNIPVEEIGSIFNLAEIETPSLGFAAGDKTTELAGFQIYWNVQEDENGDIENETLC